MQACTQEESWCLYWLIFFFESIRLSPEGSLRLWGGVLVNFFFFFEVCTSFPRRESLAMRRRPFWRFECTHGTTSYINALPPESMEILTPYLMKEMIKKLQNLAVQLGLGFSCDWLSIWPTIYRIFWFLMTRRYCRSSHTKSTLVRAGGLRSLKSPPLYVRFLLALGHKEPKNTEYG